MSCTVTYKNEFWKLSDNGWKNAKRKIEDLLLLSLIGYENMIKLKENWLI